MRTIELKKHKIELYDAVDEMPVVRYHKFTQLMVLASGVGNDINAVRGKLGGIRQMIEDGQAEKAKVEVLNLMQTFHFIDSVIDPKSLAYACMVKSIDGVETTDNSTDGLQKVADTIDKLSTLAERNSVLDDVKKKLERELAYYYPEHTDTDGEGLALTRAMLMRRVDRMMEGADLEQKDDELERLAKRMREHRYGGLRDYGEYEKESDRAFEQGCASITGELHKDAKTMTVLEYHAATRVLEERAEAMDKAKKR